MKCKTHPEDILNKFLGDPEKSRQLTDPARNGEFLFNGYRVSVLQDINLLERDWIKNVNILNFISHYT
jgi:hypothetical protein